MKEEIVQLRGYTTRLRVNEEVERYLYKQYNACIYAYNWCRDEYQRMFEELNNKAFPGRTWKDVVEKKDKSQYWKQPNLAELSRNFTAYKHLPGNEWLLDADSYALVNVTGVTGTFSKAIKNFWSKFYSSKFSKGIYAGLHAREKAGKSVIFPVNCKYFPKKTSFSFSNKSYTTDGRHIKMFQNCITLPKLTKLNEQGKKESIYVPMHRWQYMPTQWNQSVTISTDGIHHFISMITPLNTSELVELPEQSEPVGIDLGQKTIATLSDGTIIPNISKSEKYLKMEKRIRKLKHKLSTFYKYATTYTTPYGKVKKKLSCKGRAIQQRIRKLEVAKIEYAETQYKQQIAKIIQRNPQYIAFETLRVKNMMKNKKLAPSLQQTGMSKFKLMTTNACDKYGIPVIEVDPFYPSSQLCHVCGTRHPIMKNLGKRTFVCTNCGVELDRDLNAAKNIVQVDKSIEFSYNKDKERQNSL